MADDRPANDDLAAVVADMQRRYDDQISTLLARASRMPTGTVLSGLWKTPPPDTLFLQGQSVYRADYAVLWQWVQDQNLIGTDLGLFGVGDGSTTFRLPDYKGRSMVGATVARPVGTLFGESTRVITPANMAAHTHQVNIRDHMSGAGQTPAETGSDKTSHVHGFGTTGVGDHPGHTPNDAPGVGGNDGARWPTNARFNYGAHGHTGTTGNANAAHEHYLYIPPHAVSEVAVGQNTPLNIESPAFSGSWLIYC